MITFQAELAIDQHLMFIRRVPKSLTILRLLDEMFLLLLLSLILLLKKSFILMRRIFSKLLYEIIKSLNSITNNFHNNIHIKDFFSCIIFHIFHPTNIVTNIQIITKILELFIKTIIKCIFLFSI